MIKVLGVIPARYGSTRLPAKILADIHGKPMIQWVYEAAKKARALDEVVIATDDERIVHAVRGFGGKAIMTSPELNSGTDRVAAVMDQVDAEIYVNIQGDEPLMNPEAINQTVDLVSSGRFPMASVMTPFETLEDMRKDSVVKVLCDVQGRAIYFSRYPIPYSRITAPTALAQSLCRQHVGLYVFTKATLQKFRSLPATDIERAESLEQLRALYNGIPIGMTEVNFQSIGVDIPEDLEKVRKILNGKK